MWCLLVLLLYTVSAIVKHKLMYYHITYFVASTYIFVCKSVCDMSLLIF